MKQKEFYKDGMNTVVRFNYYARVFGMMLMLLILASIYYNTDNYFIWAILTFFGLIWPHGTYLISRKRKNKKLSEMIIILTEVFTAGIFVNLIGYSLLPSLALSMAVTNNMLSTWGPKFYAKGLGLFIAGNLTAAVFNGFNFSARTNTLTSIFSIVTIFIYTLFLAYLNYQNAKNLTINKNSLQKANKELSITKDKLWAEMELARKIQTILLPVDPAINGFDIAAYMQPASEVGGDYYDVINVEGYDWIVIGDVSGHGIASGIVMMMVQTSIHTAIHESGNDRPSQLLFKVNRVIRENIKRLNEDKYITITVFACLREGHFYFSGLHLDPIIYRADSKQIELLETRGMWIGLTEDISQWLHDDEIHLNSGDTMLIYTDGITDAWKEGTVENNRDYKTDMYGSDRLHETFKSSAHLSPEEIRESLKNSLLGYACHDDITFLVIKKT